MEISPRAPCWNFRLFSPFKSAIQSWEKSGLNDLMRHLIRKHLSTLPQKQVFVEQKKGLQWKFDSCANKWKSFRMHWLNFPSFNFGFSSQLRCYSCHASHGNFRCVAINWIYSQKSAAFENPQKRNGVTRSEKFSGSKIEPFPHLLLWRWQLQNHLILILPNNTGTPTQKRTPKYSSRIHIPFLHT